MRRHAKVDRNQIKALRGLKMRAQNRRGFPRKGSKGLAQELLRGFEKRRLDIRRFLKKKSERRN